MVFIIKQNIFDHSLFYKNPAQNFNETLPLGNGRIGACVYGKIDEEIVSLNEDTLWSGYPKGITKGDYPEVYKKARELFYSGKKSEAQRYLENNFGDYLVQMYLPFGKLKIKTLHNEEPENYKRELRIDRAVHRVDYVYGGVEFSRESFVSGEYDVFIMRLSASKREKISFEAGLESQLKCLYGAFGDSVYICGNAPDCVADYGSSYKTTDCQIYSDDPNKKGMGFAGVLYVKTSGADAVIKDNKVCVNNADEAVIYVALRTGFKSWNTHPDTSPENCLNKCLKDINKVKSEVYDELLKKNIASHSELYNRCEITLGGSENSALPTDERLKLHSKGEEDNSLYALLFNYGRYLTIAASRKGTQPTNLQGIWNEKILPPWNCNYTLNINTEMNYWPTLKCGLFECYNPIITMAKELAESGGITAKEFYGEQGWVCHHSTDIWRLTHPGTGRLKGNAQWGFWNMASGWIAVMLWDYYRYTLDKNYLKEIYPILEGAALFYSRLLTERNGELILSPSTSPENNYIEDGETHAIDFSISMTQEILFDLFWAVSKAGELLGENAEEYAEKAKRLKRPKVQSDGSLCEWDTEHTVWDKHHRHSSHLYGLFPSNQFNSAQKQACKKTLIERGDLGTGWSLAWKINLWASLKDGEHALKLLDNQLNPVPSDCDTPDIPGGSYPNLFCAHPPFQIDGNFGAASGIIEMLVQTDEKGETVLLPALPKKWKEGSVKGICLPNGKKINFEWKNGEITEVKEIKLC
ncbi:MAG: glycoside hydrolase family 95 protein [Clostridia bacterium]|nr:glycoside hydrolase family 95 protein [Clostridia bacterium]